MSHSTVADASGKRVYVIGDIHGCPAEPDLLLKHLEANEGLSDDDLVIFLGDYIDRGPDSRGVIDLMLDFKARFPRTRFLKGNHEDMMLDFLGFGGNMGEAFLYNGGLETIQSYGITVFTPPAEIVESLPDTHFKFYSELESIIRVADFVCVHAGLNPIRDIAAQHDGDVLWIRDEFLRSIHSFQRTVVFGHTPHKEVFQHLPYKLGIDTGLVFGNKLTCMELLSGKTFQITREEKEVVETHLDLSRRVFARTL